MAFACVALGRLAATGHGVVLRACVTALSVIICVGLSWRLTSAMPRGSRYSLVRGLGVRNDGQGARDASLLALTVLCTASLTVLSASASEAFGNLVAVGAAILLVLTFIGAGFRPIIRAFRYIDRMKVRPEDRPSQDRPS